MARRKARLTEVGLKKSCKKCGKLFYQRPDRIQTYCSRQCHYSARLEKRPRRICIICKAQFIRIPSMHQTTCSRRCGWKLERRRVRRICKQCHKSFVLPQSTANKQGTFCSTKCWQKSRQIQRPCGYCRQFFHQRRGDRPRRFCSKGCVVASRGGPLNPAWRGNRRHSRGPDWKEQATKTRERDNYKCQVCGRQHGKGEELPSVDHVIPYRLGGTNVLANLLTVCRFPCHARKTMVEPKLLRGNRLGFEQALNRLGWPMQIVEASFREWNKNPQMPLLFRQVGRFRNKCKRGHPWIGRNIGTIALKSGKIMRWCKSCKEMRESNKGRRIAISRAKREQELNRMGIKYVAA